MKIYTYTLQRKIEEENGNNNKQKIQLFIFHFTTWDKPYSCILQAKSYCSCRVWAMERKHGVTDQITGYSNCFLRSIYLHFSLQSTSVYMYRVFPTICTSLKGTGPAVCSSWVCSWCACCLVMLSWWELFRVKFNNNNKKKSVIERSYWTC